jgi:hypothetical protein
MLTYRKEQISVLEDEIFKRDNLIKVKNELIELGYQREAELVNKIKRKDRKIKGAKIWGAIKTVASFGIGVYTGHRVLR